MNELDKWNEIIETLRGSCEPLPRVLMRYNREDLEDNTEFLDELDQEIFRCNCCRWWCEISEESSEEIDYPELICKDCAKDYEDEG